MRLTISLGDQRCLSFWMTYARRWSSRAIRLLPFLREEALSCARLPAENARYPLVPLLRFTSRDIVLGARSKRLAIAEILSPCARPRLISSRSVLVSRRYPLCDCCIRIYCTHIRCVKSLTPSMIKYFIYCRKSSEEEERQIISIEAQLTELRDFAKSQGLFVVKEYTESRTAKDPGRPIFNQMLEAIEKGTAQGILAWNPDRLARNSIDGGRVIYLVDTQKIVALKFPTFWFEATPQGKFMLSVAFGQAKYYTDNLRENILRGIRQKIRRGELSAKAPLGYFNEPRLRTIEPDKKTFNKDKEILRAFAPGEYTLKKFLDQIQQALKDNSKPRKKRKEKKEFLFLNFARCGECRYCITADRKIKKSGKEYVYYFCTRKSKIQKCEQHRFLREENFAEQVKENCQKVSLP